MKINFKKLEEETGLTGINENKLILYMADLVEFLATHNKNYNNSQYNKIILLNDIFKCIE